MDLMLLDGPKPQTITKTTQNERHTTDWCMLSLPPWTSGPCWRPRSLYASVFLWISVVGGRFLVVFLEHEAGLTTAQLGTILAVAQIASVLGSTVTGSWADAWESRFPGAGRALVLAAGIFLGGMVFLLHAVPLPTALGSVTAVLWHGFLRVIFALATSMVFPVMDGMCLEFLQLYGSKQEYGKERLYGAVSWGIANVIVAWGLDAFEGFAFLYAMAVAVTVITLIVVFMYSRQQQHQQFQSQKQAVVVAPHPCHTVGYRKRDSNSILENAADDRSNKRVRKDENAEKAELYTDAGPSYSNDDSASVPRISTFQMLVLLGTSWFGFCFIVSQITQSSGQAIVDNLIFLYFEDLGSSYLLMGFTVLLTVAFEIPIFHIAPTLLQRWGPGPMIPIASISYILRVWGYSIIPEGRVARVLWLEPLHGVTFAFMATAGVELVSSTFSTPGYEASGQSALQVLVGTGSVLGLFLGGWLEELLGPRLMYRISGAVVLVGCTLFTTALYYWSPSANNDHASQINNNCDEEEMLSIISNQLREPNSKTERIFTNPNAAVEMIRLVNTCPENP